MARESIGVDHRFQLTAGTHMCCMYRGPEERDELLEPYLAEGLRAGDTCFVAVSDEDPQRLRRLQATGGPGHLIIRTATEPVFDKDVFDIDRIIAFWEKIITDALGVEGIAFVRLSAEATWWLTQIPGQKAMLRYEARLNGFAARHPVSVLCLYDIEELGAGVVFDAMKVHPRIWLSGLVLENPFFEPPEPAPHRR